MDATASPHCTRVLGLALQCISKIGAYVLFEASPKGIVLRTLNDSKSSFCAFYFAPDAFDQFFTPPGQTQKCQFLVKACQNVFRNLRGVESLRIYFDNNEVHGQEETENDNNEIVFEVKCSHQVVKRYSLVYEECELFQAVVNRDECPNCLGRKPKGLARMVEHVPLAEEICCGIAHDKMYFKSFYGNSEQTPDSREHLQSAMSIPLSEFHRCELSVSELEVVFPLKEFKAMLQFAENKELRCEEVNLYLNEPGKPVLISTKNSQTSVPFYADMILATVNLNTQTAGDVNSKKRPRDEISQITVKLTASEPF